MDAIILSLTCIINLFLGLAVILRKKNGLTEFLFARTTILVIVWIIANYFANTSGHSLQETDLANRMAYVVPLFVLGGILSFSYIFTQRRLKRLETLLLGVGFAFMIMLAPTDVIAGTVHFDLQGDVGFTTGLLAWTYVIFVVACLCALTRNFLWLPQGASMEAKKQSRYIWFSITASILIVLLANLLIPAFTGDWTSTRFGPLATVIFVATIAYSIVKHKLFDIKFAVVRTIGYGCALLTLSFAYYLLAYFASVAFLGGTTTQEVSVSPVNIILALLLAFLFQPLKQLFDKVTNRIFYRDAYDSEDFFAQLSELLASTTDLRGLLERAAIEIAKTIKAEQGWFFVYYTNSINHYITAGTKGYGRMPLYDARGLDAFLKSHNLFIMTRSEEHHV